MKKSVIILIALLLAFSLFAEEKKVQLDKMTVTGTGTKRSLSETPIKTDIIGKDDIVKKGAFTLYDALDGAPGVRVEQQCSACNFTQVRLQGMPAGNTKILINGLPLFTGLAGVYGLQQYLAANIDSIEIVRGAGSSLYGGDAVTGVINILPSDPSTKSYLSLTTMFETHNSGVFSLSGSRRTKDWALIGNVQRSYTGKIDENGDKLTDRVQSENFAGNFSLFWYNPFNFFDQISFFGSAINETRQGGSLANNAWMNPFAEGSERIQTKRFEAGVSFLKKFTKKLMAKLDAAFSSHKRDATNDAAQDEILGTTAITNASQLPMPFLADEKLYFINAGTTIKLGPKSFANTIKIGVQYRRSDFEQEIGQLAARAVTKKNADDIGIYVQDEISFNKKFEVVAGARLDFHSSTSKFTNSTLDYDENQISPRLALRYAAAKNLNLRASIGTGFRVPYHFAEDLHLCSGSPKVYKGANLKAEKSVTTTVGVEYQVTPKLQIAAGYTMIRINDKLDFIEGGSVPSGYDAEWKNMGTATSHGIDCTVKFAPLKNLKINFDFAWTDAQYSENPFAGEGYTNEDKGKNVMRSPKFSGGLTIDYSPEPFNIYMNLKYTGKMYIPYNDEASTKEIVETPNFFVLNMRVAWKASKSVSLFAGVKNLLDYVQDDKRPDDAAFIWGPYTGREFYGGATIKL